ncbi:MAG: hypothetical protein MMC33_008092 [Icmadophila ericetorum]|nr:hypothetical protein [Icmadophila ericetorum]
MSAKFLKANYFPAEATCSYVRVLINDEVTGHAIACRWKVVNKLVCWVTQLAVHENYRMTRLATSLKRELRGSADDLFRIASANPAAFMAMARALKGSVWDVDIDLHKNELENESLDPFEEAEELSMIVYTDSYVDHGDSERALKRMRKRGFLDAIETSLKMVDELLRLLSSEVLCSAFKHRLPWPKSTPINYNDLQKLQANPDIEGFGRICFPAMKAVSVTKSPEKVDFMQYLPVPEAENFPE